MRPKRAKVCLFTKGPLRATLAVCIALAASACAQTPTEKVLYSFRGGDDGASPTSNLIADAAGNLYGTTMLGGPGLCIDSEYIVTGCGTVFELVKPTSANGMWTEKVLYGFLGTVYGNIDSAYPMAGLAFDSSGNLYGTTFGGVSYYDLGTVFELSPPADGGKAWMKKILYSFVTGPGGEYPRAGVMFDAKGNLYGSTSSGAPYNGGTVFRLSPPTKGKEWTETVLYAFAAGTDGQNPGGITFDNQGNVYGTTSMGGGFSVGGDVYTNTWLGGGTAFEISPNGQFWNENQLFVLPPCVFYGQGGGTYCGTSDFPISNLVFDAAGDLYGTSELGGAGFYSGDCITKSGTYGCGTVFQLVPPTISGGTWTQNVLWEFESSTTEDGVFPQAGIAFDGAGNLYATTAGGCDTQPNTPFCSGQLGSVVELSPPTTEGGSWTESGLYTFQGAPDGAGPAAGLLMSGSTFYSTTQYGGTGNCARTLQQAAGCGTVFQITF
jgi:uncharacterized repeat protein (TIGR03803 family)